MQHIDASDSIQSLRTPTISTPRDEFKAKRGKSKEIDTQYEGGNSSSNFSEYQYQGGDSEMSFQSQDIVKNVKLNIFDTQGDLKYRAVTSAHYRNAMGALICFDLTDETSFETLEDWISQVKDSVNENCAIFLVGCKSDSSAVVIQQHQIDCFIDQMNMNYFDDSIIS